MKVETGQYYTVERRKEVADSARKLRRQFLRYKEAEIVYSIQHKKLLELAGKAGALVRIDGYVLIDRNVEYFLEGIKYVVYKVNDSDNRIGNESFELKEALREMSTVESISVLINHLVINDSDFYGADDIFEISLDKAARLYIEENSQLYDAVLDACIKSLKKYDHKKVKNCVHFFEQTNTFETAALVMVAVFEEEIHHMGDVVFLHPELPEIVYFAYIQKKFDNHNAFKNLVERYVGDEELYKKCSDAIEKRNNIKLRAFSPAVNYEEVRGKEEQKYFDVLFAKESSEKMLLELLDRMDEVDVQIEKVLDKSVRASWESALRHLQTSIYYYGNKEWLVRDFFSKIDFVKFSVMEIKKHLGEKSRIVVSDKQREYIIEVVKQNLNEELVKKDLRQDGKSTVVSKYLMALIFLSMKFQVDLPEKVLLELIKIPAPYFENLKLEKKYDFLSRYLSERDIKECIEDSLKESKICKMLLEDHIHYCSINKNESAVKVALALCQSKVADEWLQWHAFEYLYTLYGPEYVCEYILPCATGDFLLRIVQECKDLPIVEVCSILEKEYEIDPSYGLMVQLIKLGSEVAIKKYVEMVLSKRRVPEEKSSSYSATSAIAMVKDIKFLYLLEQLLDVALAKDFVDDEFWGLRNSLSKAFVNCGKDDADAVISVIKKRIKESALEEGNIRYCNYMIEDIKSNRKKFNDKPKTIKEVKLRLALE